MAICNSFFLSKSGLTRLAAILLVAVVATGGVGAGYLAVTQLNTNNSSPTPTPASSSTPTLTPIVEPSPTGTLSASPNITPTPTFQPTPTDAVLPTPTPSVFTGYTSYNTFTAVEDACKPYLQVKATGLSSSGLQLTEYGNVTWIGSANDATKLFSNVHLVMYTRLDSTSTPHFPVTKIIEIHIAAYITNSPTIPSDIIDKTEVVIPKIGLDNPQYNFSLTCIGWA